MSAPYPPLHIRAGNYPIQIFRVAESPRMQVNCSAEAQAAILGSLHTHFTYEVFFVVSGKITLTTLGAQQDYAHSIVIIPPHIPHVTIRDGESYCLLFSFDGESTIASWLEAGVCLLPMNEEVTFYIRRLTEKTLAGTAADEQAIQYLAALIFFHIFSAIQPEKQRPKTKKTHPVQHIGSIDEYINHHLHQKITLAHIALAVHISPKQVSRILYQQYGCAFPELLNRKRLANAASLLLNTTQPITRIIAATFCQSPNYFYALFKARFGLSPLQYRKKYQNAPAALSAKRADDPK